MSEKSLRTYETDTRQELLYREMYENQTLQFVKDKRSQGLYGKHMTMRDALQKLDDYVDPSDPDVEHPNSYHAYQTSESIRKKYPDDKMFQLLGLIHDVGKILYDFGEPGWAVVGDTFATGCKFPDTMVYANETVHSPDYGKYDTLGIYKKGCGIRNLYISYGHDEYLYQVLKYNQDSHKFPEKYMNIIRYHSFYPWHTGEAYSEFMEESDKNLLKDVREFNQFDLYSKDDEEFVVTDKIREYYDDLINECFPKPFKW